MTLPSREALVRRSERIWDHLAGFAAAHVGDPLVWCNVPRLGSTAYVHMSESHGVPRTLSRGEARALEEMQLTARERGPGRGITTLVGDGCLLMAATSNLKGQAALHRRFGPLRSPCAPTGGSRSRTRQLVRSAASLAEDLVDCARRHQIEYPLESGLVYRQLLRSARLLTYWEDVLAKEAPRVAVVPSLWTPPARTLIHAARRAGIPTVCVPDAALRVDWGRAGLPVDYVALRGAQEAAYLGAHSVDRERLDVVGHQTITPRRPPEADPLLPPVFAPSSERDSQLGPLVSVVHRGLGRNVIVGRHPNPAGGGQQRPFPDEWRIFDGRTYDLLQSGSPAVVQQSSGVALESMHLGIPVVELCYPGKATHFPWIREPYVRFASSSKELRVAVAAASQDAGDPAARAALIHWARGWASPTGAEAAERAVALVERARAAGSRGPIWDPWELPLRSPAHR